MNFRQPVYRPVMQTKFGAGQGNCMLACLASLLGVPIDEVPAIAPTKAFRSVMLDTWLCREWGLRLIHFSTPHWGYVPDGILYVAGGVGARGLNHAVVYDGVDMIHDPHPDGTGIESIESVYLLLIALSDKTSTLKLDGEDE